MSASVAEPVPPLAKSPAPASGECQVARLRRVPWSLYRRLRAIRANWRTQMFYDAGDLYLMSPSRLHESISTLLGVFISHWAVEKDLPIQGVGSTTYQKRDRKLGLEPDQCFYLTRLDEIRVSENVDLSKEPPPDLAIEVDVSRYSTRKLPVYAKIGVREVWLWRDGLRVHSLQGRKYIVQPVSAVLPEFPIAAVSDLIVNRGTRDQTALVREFLKIVRGK